jgi:hypothetical protein
MTGRVKDFYWDQINAAAEAAPPDPDPPEPDLEALRIDAQMAIARYRRAKEDRNEPQ